MPPNKNSSSKEPPKVMTWAKASPVLVIAAVFYALRFIFEQFWFFGPALTGLYCTVKVSGVLKTLTFGLLETKAAAVACGAAAVLVGSYGSAAFIAFGAVMAIVIGLLGSLTVWLMIVLTNPRILNERKSVVQFVASGAVSEIPIIGSLPAFEVTIFLMYLFQIKKEKAALKKWEEEQKKQAELKGQGQNQKAAQIMQGREDQQTQEENGEQENEEQSEKDEQESIAQEDVREAA